MYNILTYTDMNKTVCSKSCFPALFEFTSIIKRDFNYICLIFTDRLSRKCYIVFRRIHFAAIITCIIGDNQALDSLLLSFPPNKLYCGAVHDVIRKVKDCYVYFVLFLYFQPIRHKHSMRSFKGAGLRRLRLPY